MGYEWTTIIAGETVVEKEHFQELVDNVKNAEDLLELAAEEKHTWTDGMDPFVKNIVVPDETLETREAADNLDDLNVCRTHNATHRITYDNNEHSLYKASHYYDFDSNLHSYHKGTHFILFNGAQQSSQKGVNNGAYCSVNKGTY